MRVFDVDIGTGKVTNDKVFVENFAPGFTDGVRTDIDGNVWCSMGWADPKEDGGPLLCAERPISSARSTFQRPVPIWPSAARSEIACLLREHLGLRGLC
jgi:hypothetical protein